MDTAILSALSAVLGSLVGGCASIATAWVTQRTQSRRELVRVEIRKRETLYVEFIAECSKLAIDSYTHTMDRPEAVLPAYDLLNRLRLTSSDAVVAAADEAIRHIASQYFSPNLSTQEFHALARAGHEDPLRGFSEACRQELKDLQRQV